MNSFLRVAAAGAILAGVALPAAAQTLPLRPGQAPTVQSNLSMTFPIDKMEDVEQKRSEVLASFYRIVADSCRLLLETIADRCEVARVSSNVSVNERNAREPQMTLNGQIGMNVTFKATAAGGK